MIDRKACSECKEWKPLGEFHKFASSPDGREPFCKSCSKTAARETHKT